MKSKKKVIFFTMFLASLSMLMGSVVFAASAVIKPEVAFSQAFPRVPFESIAPSEINGVYEVISGNNIFYYYPEKDLLIVGNIINKEQRNLTGEKQAALVEKRSQVIWEKEGKNLPLQKAVKIGNGKNVIVEFTDPDCPYCRKAADFLRGRSDVTRYIFFAPLAHPNAIVKIHYILNSEDQAKAYEDMMQGKSPKAGEKYSEAIKSLAQEHIALARKMNVSGTPTFFVNGKQVVGANTDKIESLIMQGQVEEAK